MSLSPIAFFGLLDENNPVGTDSRTISDDQHRNILASMKQQAPNWTAAVTATHGDVNLLSGYVASGKKPLSGVGGQTTMWFYNNTVPVGWTLANPDANQRILCVNDGLQFGIAGTRAPSSATLPTTVVNVSVDLPADTGGHALTEAENGPHSHAMNGNNNNANLGAFAGNYLANGGPVNLYRDGTNIQNNVMIGNSGSGTAHTHPLGGTAPQTAGSGTGSETGFDPRRANGVFGVLDA